MTSRLRLHKLHGLGNDFLVSLVDELPAAASASRAAVALCDRRRGVGADGLIYAVVDAGTDGGERSAAMRLWNSDGSAAEVSGNGLRCLAHTVARSLGADEFDMVVHTVAGLRRCSLRPAASPDTVIGTTEMGSLSPGTRPDIAGTSPVTALAGILGPGEVQRWDTLDVGNPHAVVAVADLARVPVADAGAAVETLFRDGINAHFGVVTGLDELTLAVWERGAGATASCGTGAVAAAAVFHRWGAVGQDVTVRMAGGEARVDLSGPVTLTGESVYVAAVCVGDA